MESVAYHLLLFRFNSHIALYSMRHWITIIVMFGESKCIVGIFTTATFKNPNLLT